MGIALAAACVLVLQSAFGAFALGPGPVQRDALGNVICTADGAQPGPGNSPNGGHMPNCYTLGCSACSQVLAEPPGLADMLAARFFEAATAIYPSARLHLRAEEQRPGNPRAPPLFA
jgi:hypothetical protein